MPVHVAPAPRRLAPRSSTRPLRQKAPPLPMAAMHLRTTISANFWATPGDEVHRESIEPAPLCRTSTSQLSTFPSHIPTSFLTDYPDMGNDSVDWKTHR